jgi:hypothetical protein
MRTAARSRSPLRKKRHDSRCAFPLPDLVPLLVATLTFLLAGFVKDLTGLGLPTASA